MSKRLRRHSPFPPGGFPYEQTQGIYHKFKGDCDIRTQADRVSEFRKANGLERQSFEEAFEDVDKYQCIRLGGHDRWCVEDGPTTKTFQEIQPAARKVRRGCGSCGGHSR
jgi:hypothetical protein